MPHISLLMTYVWAGRFVCIREYLINESTEEVGLSFENAPPPSLWYWECVLLSIVLWFSHCETHTQANVPFEMPVMRWSKQFYHMTHLHFQFITVCGRQCSTGNVRAHFYKDWQLKRISLSWAILKWTCSELHRQKQARDALSCSHFVEGLHRHSVIHYVY